jgi:hypothetical protein
MEKTRGKKSRATVPLKWKTEAEAIFLEPLPFDYRNGSLSFVRCPSCMQHKEPVLTVDLAFQVEDLLAVLSCTIHLGITAQVVAEIGCTY